MTSFASSDIWLAFIMTLVAAISTFMGAMTSLYFRKVNQVTLSVILGFAAGIMIYTAFIDQHPILPIVLCSDENHQYGLVFCRYRFVVSFRISGEVVEEKRGGTLRRFTSILPAGSDIGASDDYRP